MSGGTIKQQLHFLQATTREAAHSCLVPRKVLDPLRDPTIFSVSSTAHHKNPQSTKQQRKGKKDAMQHSSSELALPDSAKFNKSLVTAQNLPSSSYGNVLVLDEQNENNESSKNLPSKKSASSSSSSSTYFRVSNTVSETKQHEDFDSEELLQLHRKHPEQYQRAFDLPSKPVEFHLQSFPIVPLFTIAETSEIVNQCNTVLGKFRDFENFVIEEKFDLNQDNDVEDTMEEEKRHLKNMQRFASFFDYNKIMTKTSESQQSGFKKRDDWMPFVEPVPSRFSYRQVTRHCIRVPPLPLDHQESERKVKRTSLLVGEHALPETPTPHFVDYPFVTVPRYDLVPVVHKPIEAATTSPSFNSNESAGGSDNFSLNALEHPHKTVRLVHRTTEQVVLPGSREEQKHLRRLEALSKRASFKRVDAAPIEILAYSLTPVRHPRQSQFWKERVKQITRAAEQLEEGETAAASSSSSVTNDEGENEENASLLNPHQALTNFLSKASPPHERPWVTMFGLSVPLSTLFTKYMQDFDLVKKKFGDDEEKFFSESAARLCKIAASSRFGSNENSFEEETKRLDSIRSLLYRVYKLRQIRRLQKLKREEESAGIDILAVIRERKQRYQQRVQIETLKIRINQLKKKAEAKSKVVSLQKKLKQLQETRDKAIARRAEERKQRIEKLLAEKGALLGLNEDSSQQQQIPSQAKTHRAILDEEDRRVALTNYFLRQRIIVSRALKRKFSDHELRRFSSFKSLFSMDDPRNFSNKFDNTLLTKLVAFADPNVAAVKEEKAAAAHHLDQKQRREQKEESPSSSKQRRLLDFEELPAFWWWFVWEHRNISAVLPLLDPSLLRRTGKGGTNWFLPEDMSSTIDELRPLLPAELAEDRLTPLHACERDKWAEYYKNVSHGSENVTNRGFTADKPWLARNTTEDIKLGEGTGPRGARGEHTAVDTILHKLEVQLASCSLVQLSELVLKFRQFEEMVKESCLQKQQQQHQQQLSFPLQARSAFIDEVRRWRYWRLTYAYYPTFATRMAIYTSATSLPLHLPRLPMFLTFKERSATLNRDNTALLLKDTKVLQIGKNDTVQQLLSKGASKSEAKLSNVGIDFAKLVQEAKLKAQQMLLQQQEEASKPAEKKSPPQQQKVETKQIEPKSSKKLSKKQQQAAETQQEQKEQQQQEQSAFSSSSSVVIVPNTDPRLTLQQSILEQIVTYELPVIYFEVDRSPKFVVNAENAEKYKSPDKLIASHHRKSAINIPGSEGELSLKDAFVLKRSDSNTRSIRQMMQDNVFVSQHQHQKDGDADDDEHLDLIDDDEIQIARNNKKKGKHNHHHGSKDSSSTSSSPLIKEVFINRTASQIFRAAICGLDALSFWQYLTLSHKTREEIWSRLPKSERASMVRVTAATQDTPDLKLLPGEKPDDPIFDFIRYRMQLDSEQVYAAIGSGGSNNSAGEQEQKPLLKPSLYEKFGISPHYLKSQEEIQKQIEEEEKEELGTRRHKRRMKLQQEKQKQKEAAIKAGKLAPQSSSITVAAAVTSEEFVDDFHSPPPSSSSTTTVNENGEHSTSAEFYTPEQGTLVLDPNPEKTKRENAERMRKTAVSKSMRIEATAFKTDAEMRKRIKKMRVQVLAERRRRTIEKEEAHRKAVEERFLAFQAKKQKELEEEQAKKQQQQQNQVQEENQTQNDNNDNNFSEESNDAISSMINAANSAGGDDASSSTLSLNPATTGTTTAQQTIRALREEWKSLHPLDQASFFNIDSIKKAFPEFEGFSPKDVKIFQQDWAYGAEALEIDQQERMIKKTVGGSQGNAVFGHVQLKDAIARLGRERMEKYKLDAAERQDQRLLEKSANSEFRLTPAAILEQERVAEEQLATEVATNGDFEDEDTSLFLNRKSAHSKLSGDMSDEEQEQEDALFLNEYNQQLRSKNSDKKDVNSVFSTLKRNDALHDVRGAPSFLVSSPSNSVRD